jgi:GGDEF domain-containing protein
MALVHRDAKGDSYILVVDTMNDGGLESTSAHILLEQYATLLQSLLESVERGDLAPQKPEKSVKPRRDIIADEMQKARKESKPLALALVFLNRGEEIVGSGETDIVEMESVFEARLREVATSGRVEKFGELTYGVFYRGTADTVAAWASRLQTAFVDTDGHLRGGVSVGVAQLNARHESPDDLRSDATAALQEAFESGECTIVE